jgi:hypothetical protein
MTEQLHPNIARMAASYDRLLSLMSSGQLTSEQARVRISQLEARDDHGIRWTVDPSSGRFLRRTAFGTLVPDTPPAVGIDTKDAFYYSDYSRDDNPEHKITTTSVSGPERVPTTLAGATRFSQPDTVDVTDADIDDNDAKASPVITGILATLAILFATLIILMLVLV